METTAGRTRWTRVGIVSPLGRTAPVGALETALIVTPGVLLDDGALKCPASPPTRAATSSSEMREDHGERSDERIGIGGSPFPRAPVGVAIGSLVGAPLGSLVDESTEASVIAPGDDVAADASFPSVDGGVTSSSAMAGATHDAR